MQLAICSRHTSTRAIQRVVSTVRTIIRLPIAIIPCTPIRADNPGPVPIVVRVIVISIVMPPVVVSIVTASVIISRSWRGNNAGNTEHQSKH